MLHVIKVNDTKILVIECHLTDSSKFFTIHYCMFTIFFSGYLLPFLHYCKFLTDTFWVWSHFELHAVLMDYNRLVETTQNGKCMAACFIQKGSMI